MEAKLYFFMLAVFMTAVFGEEQPYVRQLKSPYVYAQVELNGDHDLTPGKKIIFDKSIDNSNGVYSIEKGVFTAPYRGTYLFSVNLCQFTGNVWTFFDIVKDGTRLATGYQGDLKWGSCGSAIAITYMEAGSKVWVKAGKNSQDKAIKISARYTFTGALMN